MPTKMFTWDIFLSRSTNKKRMHNTPRDNAVKIAVQCPSPRKFVPSKTKEIVN
jgi:hypothetical protein